MGSVTRDEAGETMNPLRWIGRLIRRFLTSIAVFASENDNDYNNQHHKEATSVQVVEHHIDPDTTNKPKVYVGGKPEQVSEGYYRQPVEDAPAHTPPVSPKVVESLESVSKEANDETWEKLSTAVATLTGKTIEDGN